MATLPSRLIFFGGGHGIKASKNVTRCWKSRATSTTQGGTLRAAGKAEPHQQCCRLIAFLWDVASKASNPAGCFFLGGDAAWKKAAKNGEPHHQCRRCVKGHYPSRHQTRRNAASCWKRRAKSPQVYCFFGTWCHRPVTLQVDYFWGDAALKKAAEMWNQITNTAGCLVSFGMWCQRPLTPLVDCFLGGHGIKARRNVMSCWKSRANINNATG